MINTIKGINSALILHEDKFFALCLKVKNAENQEMCFYLQVPVLKDLLLTLASRLKICLQQELNENIAIEQESNQLINNAPLIHETELQRPEPLRRVGSIMMEPNIDSYTVHFIMQSEQINSLLFQNTQVKFILQLIVKTLNNVNSTDLITFLTSTLDYLPLYDVEFKDNGHLQYDQYPQEPWKQKLFTSYIKLTYEYKKENNKNAYFGAIIKTSLPPKSPEIEHIAKCIVQFSNRLCAYKELPYIIHSDIIPAPAGTILTIKECLYSFKNLKFDTEEK